MKRLVSVLVTVPIVMVLACVQAWGQGAQGTILGEVSDSTGAVVAGAAVTIVNEDTNVSQTTSTSSTGTYSVPYLKPGPYSVTVEAKGFAGTKTEHINLLVDQSVRVSAVLHPSSTTELVTVTADPVQLDTETAGVGQVISRGQVSDLPLNGRNFTSFLILQPGAVNLNGPQTGEQSTRPNSGDSFSLGGGRPTANQYLVDGVSINDVLYQTPAFQPSIDAVQEFKAQTQTYSAEYGTSSNQINISYKSGTNLLHGTAFDFLRNNFVDARSYFDQTVPILRQNDFGYSLGGPVIIPKLYNGRNRTFFFANYEGLRETASPTEYLNLPTSAQLGGQFTTPITDPSTGLPFPGNQIPQSRISTFAKIMNGYLPVPNTNTPQGNFVGTASDSIATDQQNYRVDQNFGSNNSIFGRYTVANYSYLTGAIPATSGYNHPIDAKNYQVTYAHIFSPTIVNQARYGHLDVAADQLGVTVPQSVIDAFGFTGIYNPLTATARALPFTSVTGYLNWGVAVNTPWLNDQKTNEFDDSITFTHGRQTLAFGLGYRRWTIANNTTTGFTGQFTFNGLVTGNAFADYLLGDVDSYFATQPTSTSDPKNPGSPVNIVYSSIAPFFQDDWKVTNRLTVNLGLRYDWSSVPYEQKNHWSWIDPNIPGGGLCVADPSLISSGLGANLYAYCGSRTAGSSQKTPFAPRVGFAYNPHDKWVVRSGFGLFYDTAETFEDIGSGNIYPYTIRTNYDYVLGAPVNNTANLFPNLSAPGPVTTADLSFYEPQSRKRFDPYVMNWSLSIEHELAKRTKLEVYYAGSKGNHLNTRLDSNQPYDYNPANPTPPSARLPFPNFGLIVEEGWSAYSNYNSLNAKLESNVGNLDLVAAYTWAKSMDDKSSAAALGGDATGWSGQMDTHNPRLDYSVSAFDIPQRLVASFTYKLPIGRGQRFLSNAGAVVDRVLGGWQLNGITTFQSGLPYTIFATDAGFYNGAYGQRANVVGKPYPSGFHQSANEWFNTTAFAQPALGIYGNSPRNFLRGQGINNSDLSLFKNIPFGEKVAFQLRLEAFNAFNRTQFYFPNVTQGTPTFGVIGSAAPGRIVQLAAKVIW